MTATNPLTLGEIYRYIIVHDLGAPNPVEDVSLGTLLLAFGAAISETAEASYYTVPPPSGDPTGATDTANLLLSISAGNGVRIWPGTYYLNAMVDVPGVLPFIGQGGAWSGPIGTHFICVNSGAGLTFTPPTAGGLVADFIVDGNGIATTPLVVSCSYRRFDGVEVINSAGSGWTILNAQNCQFNNPVSKSHVLDGYYIDQGSGGLQFNNPQSFDCHRYQWHGDALVAGGGYPSPTDIEINGGIFDNAGSGGISELYLRGGCGNWRLNGPPFGVVGTGPGADCDHTCSYIYFNDQFVEGTVTPGGANPGHVDYALAGGPYFFNGVVMSGDTSIYFNDAAHGAAVFMLPNCVDVTTNGPVSISGLGPPELLISGTAGPWHAATLLNGWTNVGAPFANASYRITADGSLQLAGLISGGTYGTVAFNLPAGFGPTSFPIRSTYTGATVSLQEVSGIWEVVASGTGDVSLDGIYPRNI